MQSTEPTGPGVVVILGCRAQASEPTGALLRRLLRAREWTESRGAPAFVVMSGGKSWAGRIEADVMAQWWQAQGLPGTVLAERNSQNTRQNAQHTVRMLEATQAPSDWHLVTCDYHMARATAEFRRLGKRTSPAPAASESGSLRTAKNLLREVAARLLGAILPMALLSLAGCREAPAPEANQLPSLPTELAVPPHAGSERNLEARAREPFPEDEEALQRALLGTPNARIWGAFGLGQLCSLSNGNAKTIEDTLISAASMWLLSEPMPAQGELVVLAQALGACATPRVETALRAWLELTGSGTDSRLVRAAAYGLGALVDRRGSLDDQTLSRLLELAESTKTPGLLYPLGRIARLSRAVSERTIEVSGKLLLSGSPESLRDAIFALGSAGSPAASALAAIAESQKFKLSERTAAAQALARLGERGNVELDQLIGHFVERGIPTNPSDPEWIVLFAALSSLAQADTSSEALDLLRRGPLPDVTPGPGEDSARAERRRLVHLRCRAAELQAGLHFEHQHLQNCDPDHSFIGKLALLRVLDKVDLKDRAQTLMERLLVDEDATVRESALALVSAHREFAGARARVLELLGSPNGRLRAAAFRAVSVHSERFQLENEPDPEVVQLVRQALENASTTPDVLVRALDAAGALRALTLKPMVEKHCSTRSVAARSISESARRALGLLGDPKHTCTSRSALAPTLTGPPASRSYVLESELGPIRITLQPELSPTSAAAFASELEANFFAISEVKTTREGFLIEWGPALGTPARGTFPLIYADISPEIPRAGDILFQPPETPGGQGALLFALSDAPELAGKKAIVGRFEGPLELLVPGDPLRVTPEKR